MLTSSEEESDREQPSLLCFGKRRTFTTKQQAVLMAHYKTGMQGVWEEYSLRVVQAAREAGPKNKSRQKTIALRISFSRDG